MTATAQDFEKFVRNKPTSTLETLRSNYKYETEDFNGRYTYHKNCNEAQHAIMMIGMIEKELKFRGKNHKLGRP